MIGASIPRALSMVAQAAAAFQVLVQAALASIRAFQMGITSAIPGITAAAIAMARALTSTVSRVVSGDAGAMGAAGYSIGSAIVAGMRNGIQNGSSSVSAAARTVAQRALAASKQALGVASPSKEYFKIGNWMDEGMADGQLQNINKVESASTRVGKSAVEAMRKSLSGLKSAVASDMQVQPTIRPVLDMSQVRAGAGQLNSILTAPKLRLDTNRAMAVSTQTAVDTARENSGGNDGPAGGAPQVIQHVTFNQVNNSPKALPRAEIYRDTSNLISRAKEELAKK